MVFAVAHHRQLYLVLDVFDVESAARGLPANQGVDHAVGQRGDLFAHARRSSALAAVDGNKRLGHRDGDFRRLKADDGAVAANDLVLRVHRLPGRVFGGDCNLGINAGLVGIDGDLHVHYSLIFLEFLTTRANGPK